MASALLPDSGFADVDAALTDKLDIWGAYHRIGVASVTMAVTFWVLPQPGWLLAVAGTFLLIALFAPRALRRLPAPRRTHLRSALMLADVAVVSVFVFYWGPRTSPAPFLYLPIVSGWTPTRQRHVGRATVVAVLLAYGGLLGIEQLGWLAPGPATLLGAAHGASTGASSFFVVLACCVVAVHVHLDLTMGRLYRHTQVVSGLTAESRTREREAQLVAQLEEAQRLEALGRLAGGISHDFNNLLTVLLGCAELAETNVGKDEAVARRALRELRDAAENGASLTSQLLDFASRRPARRRDVDLNQVIVSAGQLLEHLLEAEVELQVQTHDQPCVVHLDPSGLERVLLNLAVNARDAMPEGGTLTIAVSTRPASEADVERVVLEVSDTGVGIPRVDLAHIFEPFFTTKVRGKGTGLGLASVYGIVKQNQGQIEVDSTPGAGTTFRMQWPRVHRASVPAPVPTRPLATGRELILLVDDNAAVRTVALAHLQSAGYQVVTAGSGEEALELLHAHRAAVRLIVSDVSMPGMSGVELAAEVRAQYTELPILLISGYSDELHDGAHALARFLAKPFTAQRLLAEVRRALDQAADPGRLEHS